MINATATVADADLAWLHATVQMYENYLKDASNPHARKIFLRERDRYARIAQRLTPRLTANDQLMPVTVVSRIANAEKQNPSSLSEQHE